MNTHGPGRRPRQSDRLLAKLSAPGRSRSKPYRQWISASRTTHREWKRLCPLMQRHMVRFGTKAYCQSSPGPSGPPHFRTSPAALPHALKSQYTPPPNFRNRARASLSPSIAPSESSLSTTNHSLWSPSSGFIASETAARIQVPMRLRNAAISLTVGHGAGTLQGQGQRFPGQQGRSRR